MGYQYNHSDGVNVSVGDPEYLEPPGILGHNPPQLFRVISGLKQSYSSEHYLECLSPYSMWKVKVRTLESK